VLGRFFKSGNSMAVRIPKELAFAETIQEVETERIGNTLGVCPLEEQTRDVTDGETRDGLRLFMMTRETVFCACSAPRNRGLSLISSLAARRN
jgi:virulence-associated protein VagC